MRHNQIIFQRLESYQDSKNYFIIKIKYSKRSYVRLVCIKYCSRSANLVNQIIRNESLLKSLCKLLEYDILEIKKQIAFFLANSAIYSDLDDFHHLVMSHEFIYKYNLLNSNDKTIIQVSLLEILEFIKEVIIAYHLVQYDGKFQLSKKLLKSSISLNSFIQRILCLDQDIEDI
ncbi:unnamed protein product [Paramecium pentaurelia]|uniref:Uncharacterized protein n=1 Tax=Paramecium pentaurelia TaxID=43138 RepID=A0A8S1YMF5_9CILI|nr:unnamed protein product [Paramecium pentaurelia]